jgi:prepilin-type N-terminal cleavage/methylation domain-containing protein
MNRQSGFTLIEISIVLVIIALILGGMMLSGTITIGNTKATGTITLIKELSGAINDFKSRYRYLPGDLPNASQDFPGQITIGTACDLGNGNGLIVDPVNEIPCVASHLVFAGLIKGSASGIVSPFGSVADVFVLANSSSATFATAWKFGTPASPPVQVLNVIQIVGIPCDAAKTIDSKIDDGDGRKGSVRITLPDCVNGITTLNVAL